MKYFKVIGPAETWTRIVGFRVQSAYHYTTEPVIYLHSLINILPVLQVRKKYVLRKFVFNKHKTMQLEAAK